MDDLNRDRARCDVCRTINLAKNAKFPKPDMEMYDKGCPPALKPPCGDIPESSNKLTTRITMCKKDDYGMRLAQPVVPKPHSRLLYLVKAGVVVGSAYFTYAQGIWGDQQDVSDCIKRWQGYIRDLNKRSPKYDQCGKEIKRNNESIIAPIYDIYKHYIMSLFSAAVTVPRQIKCAYVDYIQALEKKWEDALKNKK